MHSNCYANGGKTLFTAQRKALLYNTCVMCSDRWCSPSFRFRGVEYGMVGRLILTFFFFSTGVFSGFSTLVSSPTGSGSVFLSSLVSYLANHFRACLARDKNIKIVLKNLAGKPPRTKPKYECEQAATSRAHRYCSATPRDETFFLEIAWTILFKMSGGLAYLRRHGRELYSQN